MNNDVQTIRPQIMNALLNPNIRDEYYRASIFPLDFPPADAELEWFPHPFMHQRFILCRRLNNPVMFGVVAVDLVPIYTEIVGEI